MLAKGKFYGVGVGPGDPELITLKAVRILREAEVIVAPRTEKKDESTALSIARPYIGPDAVVLELVFPMVFDESDLAGAWEKNRNTIRLLLEAGKNVAFLTLGDPMLYSTYIHVYRLLKQSDVEIEAVPGVTSFCAAASRAGFPLADGNEVLSIVPATSDYQKLESVFKYSDNLVLMKVYKNHRQVVAQMKEFGLNENAVMISRCGLDGEDVIYNLDNVGERKPDYLTTVLAKKKAEEVFGNDKA
ncbi:MAG: precorrin-2 C(20)-methyltransferase [Firmicutes bacterium]|nr:precorrin-2 C(20)-methyltransferase [Bacillota bacterium]